jgi:hypothetical protein
VSEATQQRVQRARHGQRDAAPAAATRVCLPVPHATTLQQEASSMDNDERQRIIDEEHVRLLRIGYIVLGVVAVFTSLFGLVYIVMGAMMGSFAGSMPQKPGDPPPVFVVWFMVGFGLLFLLAAGTWALLSFLTARGLRRRRWRGLCFVAAAVSCLYIPFGTLIGAFTFIVLGRPGVRAMFERRSVPEPDPGNSVPPA